MLNQELSSDVITALPDLILATGAITLLLAGLFSPTRLSFKITASGSIAVLIIVLLALAKTAVPAEQGQVAFNCLFISNSFTSLCKSFIAIIAILIMVMSAPHYGREGMGSFEAPVLFLFSVLGMFLLVSSHDLIALFMSLELQSLCFYILVSIRRMNDRSSEAGLKYFFLGSLSTALYLYGASLLYGFSGTTGFSGIADFLSLGDRHSNVDLVGIKVGLSLILASLAFKVSLTPFHVWIPDVYEGSPTPTTVLIATAPKIAVFSLMAQLLCQTFSSLSSVWIPIVTVFSVLSIIFGTLTALLQTNIRRLLAYSTIAHMGYAFLGLINHQKEGIESTFIYLTIYSVMTIGVFATLLNIRRNGAPAENIQELSRLSNRQPLTAVSLAILMFSLTGIPPFAGFFAKVSIFRSIIRAGHSEIAVLGVIASVIAAAYYLRIVRTVFFGQSSEDDEWEVDQGTVHSTNLVMLLSVTFLVTYAIVPSALESLILHATRSFIISRQLY